MACFPFTLWDQEDSNLCQNSVLNTVLLILKGTIICSLNLHDRKTPGQVGKVLIFYLVTGAILSVKINNAFLIQQVHVQCCGSKLPSVNRWPRNLLIHLMNYYWEWKEVCLSTAGSNLTAPKEMMRSNAAWVRSVWSWWLPQITRLTWQLINSSSQYSRKVWVHLTKQHFKYHC